MCEKKLKRLEVRMAPSQLKALRRLANKSDKSLSQWVRDNLERALEIEQMRASENV